MVVSEIVFHRERSDWCDSPRHCGPHTTIYNRFVRESPSACSTGFHRSGGTVQLAADALLDNVQNNRDEFNGQKMHLSMAGSNRQILLHKIGAGDLMRRPPRDNVSLFQDNAALRHAEHHWHVLLYNDDRQAFPPIDLR